MPTLAALDPGDALKIAAALSAAVASLIVALASFFAIRSNQRDIERLKAELEERRAERDALRDYEYDARKRLYQECGPLIFQLLEQAEGVLDRIGNLARAASGGNLAPGRRSWLSRDYYRLSTLHRFVAPMATLSLIQRRLTIVDLSLDRHLYFQYAVARQIYSSFADDFDLAKLSEPPLSYDPHARIGKVERTARPDVYWQQGIPRGILDNAVDALILREPNGIARVMSFATFENEYNRTKSLLRRAFDRIAYLFDQFHPESRPVLWRILVAQAHLYRALLNTRTRDASGFDLGVLAFFRPDERERFDWRATGEKVENTVVLEVPFQVAQKYVSLHLTPILEKLSSGSVNP